MNNLEQLVETAKALGASAAAVVDAKNIPFSESFRAACEQNTCGNYGKNWMCPPAVGEYEALKTKIQGYSGGVIFQTIYQLEDSFDFEGMGKAGTVHTDTFRKIEDFLQKSDDYNGNMSLNVGACKVCETCAYINDEPCRFPEKAVASLEACCINVNELLTRYGLAYNNGPNTVSFVGLFLFPAAD